MTEGSSVDTHSCSESFITDSAWILAEAIRSISSKNTQKYFVPNFEPTKHDINAWYKEVERAITSNN